MFRLGRSTLVAAGLIALAATAGRCQAPRSRSAMPLQRGVIRVVGQAQVSAPPDEATFTIGVSETDPSAQAAMKRASDAIAAILQSLESDGVRREDLQTVTLRLEPIWRPHPTPGGGESQDYSKPPDAFMAMHDLLVHVPASHFDRLGTIFQHAASFGANSMGGVQFGVRDPEALRTQGLAQAMRDATAKARILAEAGGVELGRPVRIDEGVQPIEPLPFARAAMAQGPVAPSQVDMTATVTVEYAIGKAAPSP